MLHSLMAAGLVLYLNVSDVSDAILSVTDINAPAILCDSSVSLMSHLLHARNMEVPGGSSLVSHHVIHWLSAKWNPGESRPSFSEPVLTMTAERSFSSRTATDVQPIEILNLLRTCLGLPRLRLSRGGYPPCGAIGYAWVKHLKRNEMLHLLLVLESPPKIPTECSKCPRILALHLAERPSDASALRLPMVRLVVELFLPKFESLLQEWDTHGGDQPSQVSADILSCTISTCLLGALLLSTLDNTASRHIQELAATVSRLVKFMLATIHDSKDSHAQIESLMISIQPYLPASNVAELKHLSQHATPLLQLFNSLAIELNNRRGVANNEDAMDIDDPIDLEDMFETQQSSNRTDGTKNVANRRHNSIFMSSEAFFATTCSRLNLLSIYSETQKDSHKLPGPFVDHILNLSDSEVLLCKGLLRDVLQSDFATNPMDADRLLIRMGEMLQLEYNCSEVSLSLCLNVMSGLIADWAYSESSEYTTGGELYDWIIRTVMKQRRLSADVQSSVANLLYELMRVKPNYGEMLDEQEPLPSARSILLDLLQKGNIQVKFIIGNKLPALFSLFALKLHLDVFSDVLDSLPLATSGIEGIAFRLHVLSALAAKWPTLLRRCVYYIMEVPGWLPESSEYATRCLCKISLDLGLKTTQDLFQLFASQLLYTWLQSEPVETIPHAIFGYKSQVEFMKDNQEEIVALMIMRSQDNNVVQLAPFLGVSLEDLLKHSFTKVIGYSLAHDISIPPSANFEKPVAGEARVRKIIGKESFYQLLNHHFADIIALLFNIIDQEENIANTLAKDDKFKYAANILNDIKSFNASTGSLPPNQQPAFKAKFLVWEIDYLCTRTQYEVGGLYTPAIVVSISRGLLNTIHPALGSLHACSVLRKLRVLLALSDATVLSGYPLEMLILSVRPHVTDTECAEDAMGIIQYLLTRGSHYLESTPSFVVGISLSILASLKVFLESRRSSTTQDSQYQSTLTKAQRFHKWLGNYLSLYHTGLTGASDDAFRAIVQSAYSIREIGNAESGTPESTLLLEILEDERSGRNLLNKSSRELAFSLLYNKFQSPDSFRSDILGSDEMSIKYATSVWSVCQNTPTENDFLAWAGKVLGRAFVANGEIPHQFLQESFLGQIVDLAGSTSSQETSRSCIYQLLHKLTLIDDHKTAGLAESVLRVVVSGLEDTVTLGSDFAACQTNLPQPLFQASLWTPFQVPPSDSMCFDSLFIHDPFASDAILDINWLPNLAMYLVQAVPSDICLPTLKVILKNVPGFAEDAFPFVLHLVLLSQFDSQHGPKRQLSGALQSWLVNDHASAHENIKILINALLYLQTQSLPREHSSADRIHWLDVDYAQASRAAVKCGMFKTALLFLEISVSENNRVTTRRSSGLRMLEPKDDLMLSIFKHIDDPDMFYGIEQTHSLDNIVDRLEYEKDGMKSLAFRSAQYDAHLRQGDGAPGSDARALVRALGVLSLDGLSHSLQSQQTVGTRQLSSHNMFEAARRLEQWDLPVPATTSDDAATIYVAFQTVYNAMSRKSVRNTIHSGLGNVVSGLIKADAGANGIHGSLRSLAILTEMDEILSSEQFEEMLIRFQSRLSWMKTGR